MVYEPYTMGYIKIRVRISYGPYFMAHKPWFMNPWPWIRSVDFRWTGLRKNHKWIPNSLCLDFWIFFVWNFIAHLLVYVKNLSDDVHLPQHLRKSSKKDFQFLVPGNWFEFGIIENDFSSSIIWAIQIQVSFAGLKNRKNPGVQPIHSWN